MSEENLKDVELRFKSSIRNFIQFVIETREMGMSAAEAETSNYHIRIEDIEGELEEPGDIGEPNVMETLVGFVDTDLASEIYSALCLLDENLRTFDFNPTKGKLVILAGSKTLIKLTRK